MSKVKIYFLCLSILLVIATALVYSADVADIIKYYHNDDILSGSESWFGFLSIFVGLNWFDYFLKYFAFITKSDFLVALATLLTLIDLVVTAGACFIIFLPGNLTDDTTDYYVLGETGDYLVFSGFLMLFMINVITSFYFIAIKNNSRSL